MKYGNETYKRISRTSIGLTFSRGANGGGLLNQSGPVDVLETMMKRGSTSSPSSKCVEESMLLRLEASSFVRWWCV